jgi:hypothetical protein
MIDINDEGIQQTLRSLLTDTSRVKIYREIKAEFEEEDISMRAKDCGISMSEEEIKQAQDFMQRHHDCEISYWDNVDAAINFVKEN